jgi:four helix bundle protein
LAYRRAASFQVVVKLTQRPPFSHDFKHRSQVQDAIDSVCRNIAEGFGCVSHAEFARYLEIARRSLNEVCDCIRSARLKGYISELDGAEIQALVAGSTHHSTTSSDISVEPRLSVGRRFQRAAAIIQGWRSDDNCWICSPPSPGPCRRSRGN